MKFPIVLQVRVSRAKDLDWSDFGASRVRDEILQMYFFRGVRIIYEDNVFGLLESYQRF